LSACEEASQNSAMEKTKNGKADKIELLLEREQWKKARALLEKDRAKAPRDHWVLTQLGVTYYEERDYTAALELFLASLKIVPDCPLTLWNLAGTLDALGEPLDAIWIYTWLIEHKAAPRKDPCWESVAWAQALKTDCVYRLGVCFQHLKKAETAERFYRRYIDLLLLGRKGSYAIEQVMRQLRALHASRGNAAEDELREVVASAFAASGIESRPGRPSTPPQTGMRELLRR
jgi:tetratricopeptide (TPR) repeat protein